MTDSYSRSRLPIWLLTAAICVPLGWWAARPLARPASDLVWATLTFGPSWVVLRLVAGDFQWNAFFFGFLAPILAFEALEGLNAELRRAALLIALAPLLVYAIIGFTNLIMFGGARAARLAREATDPYGDARAMPRRFGRWLRASVGSAVRWYAIWLGGAGIGFGLALATQALARSAGIPPGTLPLELLSRAVVGLIAGGLVWALLRYEGLHG